MADEVIKSTGGGGTVAVRTDLADEITVGQDLAPTAAAAAAKAEIEARILQALKYRRDVDQFRADFLKDCKRPTFAEVAIYRKPIAGKTIEGLSIRAIEAALQAYTNIHVVSRIVTENAERLLLQVSVIDVQRNIGYVTEATIDKLVERKEIKRGRVTRGMRENSYGDMVYLVEATKDELRNLVGAERSKLVRDNGKRLLPGDILDEAWTVLETTLANENAKDPDAAKKKVLDKFAALGVSPAMLKDHLGRPLETLTLKDLNELATLHNGLKDGEISWADVVRQKQEAAEAEKPPQKSGTLRDKIVQPPEGDKK